MTDDPTQQREAVARALFLSEMDPVTPEAGDAMWGRICKRTPETQWHEQADRFLALTPVQPTGALALLRGEVATAERQVDEAFEWGFSPTGKADATGRRDAFRRALHIVEHAEPVQPDPLRAGVEALADEWADDFITGGLAAATPLHERVAALRALLAETEVPRG